MTELTNHTETYLGSFGRLKADASHAAHPWLAKLRNNGMDHFAEVGFPSVRDEQWLHTNVTPIAKRAFAPATAAATLPRSALAEYSFADQAAVELVFVNGRYSPDLSTVPALARNVRVLSLLDAIKTDPERLGNHLAQYADINTNPFVALNAAFLQHGAFIHIPRGVAPERPIHLLFLSTPSPEPIVAHPRVLILADDTSEASIVETYAATEDCVYFTNAVTEIVVGHNARIEHCKVQQEALSAYHVATTEVRLGRAAYFLSHSASLGSQLTRNDINVVLGGSGGEAMLNGVTLIDGTQHVDNHTLLDHKEPRCPSHEFYKAVLDGKASGVFKGKILVRPGAQKTDSKQSSKTLLLSDDAIMHSQPALEIYADDVKCTHGSTTGPVDDQQIFYLRSRGVGLEAARHLLTYAFLAEITGRIRIRPVRERLEAIMAARHGLPRDLRVADIVGIPSQTTSEEEANAKA
jgi:Fe-S cluster assembly protein SufD